MFILYELYYYKPPNGFSEKNVISKKYNISSKIFKLMLMFWLTEIVIKLQTIKLDNLPQPEF